MIPPGIVILLFGLLVLGDGSLGYTASANIASLVAGSVSGLGLLASDLGAFRRREQGFIVAPFITLLLIAFSDSGLVLHGDFIPAALIGILGLIAIVLYCALPAEESL